MSHFYGVQFLNQSVLLQLFNNPDKLINCLGCLGTYFFKESIDESRSITVESIISLSLLPLPLPFL